MLDVSELSVTPQASHPRLEGAALYLMSSRLFRDESPGPSYPWTEVEIDGDGLASRSMDEIHRLFKEDGNTHQPSRKQELGLWQICQAFQAMTCLHKPQPYTMDDLFISSLACGMGKTTAIIGCMRALASLSEYDDVGGVLFVRRLEEIEAIIERSKLDPNFFSVICGDEYYDRLGNPNKQQARWQISTQKQLEIHTKNGRPFTEADVFHYEFDGKPRPRIIRIWDEAITPAVVLALDEEKADKLHAGFRRLNYHLAREYRHFVTEYTDREKYPDGSLIEFFDIRQFGVSLQKALSAFRTDTQKNTIEAIFTLSGLATRLRRDNFKNATVFNYVDVLPKDLGPMLICDASGAQTASYELWQEYRGHIHALYSPPKFFDEFHVYHWDTGAGKSSQAAFGRNTKYLELAEGFAKAINSLPNEEHLVITFLPNDNLPDVAAEIAKLVEGDKNRVKYLTWGQHTATNDYKDIKNVHLVGILEYAPAHYEAAGLSYMGAPIEYELTDEQLLRVRLGEVAHNILQAACRGFVRNAIGDRCPEGCRLYVAFSTNKSTGVPKGLLEKIFPRHQYHQWVPVPKLARNQILVAEAIEHSTNHAIIIKADLCKRLGFRDQRQLNRLLKHQNVGDYLRERGITFSLDEPSLIRIKRDNHRP